MTRQYSRRAGARFRTSLGQGMRRSPQPTDRGLVGARKRGRGPRPAKCRISANSSRALARAPRGAIRTDRPTRVGHAPKLWITTPLGPLYSQPIIRDPSQSRETTRPSSRPSGFFAQIKIFKYMDETQAMEVSDKKGSESPPGPENGPVVVAPGLGDLPRRTRPSRPLWTLWSPRRS